MLLWAEKQARGAASSAEGAENGPHADGGGHGTHPTAPRYLGRVWLCSRVERRLFSLVRALHGPRRPCPAGAPGRRSRLKRRSTSTSRAGPATATPTSFPIPPATPSRRTA